MTNTTPEHKVGDIVNGHRLEKQPNGSMAWVAFDPKAAKPKPVKQKKPADPNKPKWYTLKWVQLVGVGVIAFALGSAIGASGATNSDDIEALTAQVEDLQTDVRVAEAELGAVEDERDFALGQVEDYQAREADIAAKEQALTDRETAITDAEQVKAANTIRDGGYIVGVSLEPGVYRTTTATTSCYWAIYTSGTNRDDIIDNSFGVSGTSEVTLAAGQDFETSSCGEWTKVG